jgi:hypothetical protein
VGNGHCPAISSGWTGGVGVDQEVWLAGVSAASSGSADLLSGDESGVCGANARDWNVKASGAGFVMRFAVNAAYLGRFPVQTVGGSVHTEYWIPAEELAEFNANIVGLIEVIEEFWRV